MLLRKREAASSCESPVDRVGSDKWWSPARRLSSRTARISLRSRARQSFRAASSAVMAYANKANAGKR